MSDTAVFFERLKKVDSKTNHLIHGYFREYETKAFGELLKIKPYYNLPQILPTICMIFYHITDKWDEKAIGSEYKLTKNGFCIEHIESCWQSAFGTKIFSSPGQYYWKFRLNNAPNENIASIIIGVWRIKSSPKPITDSYWTSVGHKYGYALDIRGAKLVNESGQGLGEQYGEKCEIGDIIEMCLDFDNRTLGFIINGKDMGPSHTEIEDTEYRLAVSTLRRDSSIEIVE